ncbi:MAG: ORF6N domain-containing protein [bacterium]|nr:ORF6N domain-containing protein [bacterium]
MNEVNVADNIKNMIFTIRGQNVMIDRDLANLYEVDVKALNRAVKRNIERFPEFFMFQLTDEETKNLRYQFGTAKISAKSRYNPYVFTEQGVAMLSSVLNSKKAIQVNIQIMMTFVQVRQFALENKELNRRLTDLEQLFIEHCKDNQLDNQELMQAINLLMDRTKPTKIGFVTDDKK